MRIGQLTKQTGASQKAIRLYESMGLLGPVERRGAYRHYSAECLATVMLIRQAQALGFKLAELKRLVKGNGQLHWQEALILLQEKRCTLARELARLTQQDLQLAVFEKELQSCLIAPLENPENVEQHNTSSMGEAVVCITQASPR